MWLFLSVYWPFIKSYYYKLEAEMMRRRPIVLGMLAILMVMVGYILYAVAYYDLSEKWTIPLRMKRDAAGVLAVQENSQNMQRRLQELPVEIEKHRQEVRELANQQRYLYNHLFKAVVDLERNSNLDYSLIQRIGPMANLYLKDLTKTEETKAALSAYAATLPQDSPIIPVIGELITNLDARAYAKQDFFKNISQYRVEEMEAENLRAQQEAARQAAEAERQFQELMKPPAPPPPIPDRPRLEPKPEEPKAEEPVVEEVVPMPNHQENPPQEEQPVEEAPFEEAPVEEEPQVEVLPISYRTSTSISDKDGAYLWKAHKLMSDIEMIQSKMVKTAQLIVHKYELIDTYTTELQLEAADPSVKIPGTKLPVRFMFVQDKAEKYIQEGMGIYQCQLGLFWCSRVGTVKGISGQPAKGKHPLSDRMVEGFLVPIELTDPKAGRATVLHLK